MSESEKESHFILRSGHQDVKQEQEKRRKKEGESEGGLNQFAYSFMFPLQMPSLFASFTHSLSLS